MFNEFLGRLGAFKAPRAQRQVSNDLLMVTMIYVDIKQLKKNPHHSKPIKYVADDVCWYSGEKAVIKKGQKA